MVGGLLYGFVTMPVFLIIYIIASTFAILLESTMDFKLFSKRKESVVGESKETMVQSMKAGLSYLKLQPTIMVIIWISLAINFLFGAFQVGYSYILIEKMKMAPQHFGFTEGAFAVGMLLMSIYLSIRKEVKYPLLVGKHGILAMALIMGGIAMPLLFEVSYYAMFTYYATLMFSFGLVQIIVNTPMMVMLQKIIDDDYKGRVFSILETMSMALMPLGMVLYGFLYDIFLAQWILIFSSLLLVGVVLVLARPSTIRKAHPELEERKRLFIKS